VSWWGSCRSRRIGVKSAGRAAVPRSGPGSRRGVKAGHVSRFRRCEGGRDWSGSSGGRAGTCGTTTRPGLGAFVVLVQRLRQQARQTPHRCSLGRVVDVMTRPASPHIGVNVLSDCRDTSLWTTSCYARLQIGPAGRTGAGGVCGSARRVCRQRLVWH